MISSPTLHHQNAEREKRQNFCFNFVDKRRTRGAEGSRLSIGPVKSEDVVHAAHLTGENRPAC